MWIQQRLGRIEFELKQIDGTKNPAVLFTKHRDSANKLKTLIELFGCEFRTGRPNTAPELKKAKPQVNGELRLVQTTPERNAGGVQSSAVHASEPRGLCLPHLLSDEVIKQQYESAIPEDERIGEPDYTPNEELEDPVPKLNRIQTVAENGQKKQQCFIMEQYHGTDSHSYGGAARASTQNCAPAVGECLPYGTSVQRYSSVDVPSRASNKSDSDSNTMNTAQKNNRATVTRCELEALPSRPTPSGRPEDSADDEPRHSEARERTVSATFRASPLLDQDAP